MAKDKRYYYKTNDVFASEKCHVKEDLLIGSWGCAQCGEITTSIHLLNDDDPDPSQRKIIFWCDNCLNKLKT
jgi:hypothetical protein